MDISSAITSSINFVNSTSLVEMFVLDPNWGKSNTYSVGPNFSVKFVPFSTVEEMLFKTCNPLRQVDMAMNGKVYMTLSSLLALLTDTLYLPTYFKSKQHFEEYLARYDIEASDKYFEVNSLIPPMKVVYFETPIPSKDMLDIMWTKEFPEVVKHECSGCWKLKSIEVLQKINFVVTSAYLPLQFP